MSDTSGEPTGRRSRWVLAAVLAGALVAVGVPVAVFAEPGDRTAPPARTVADPPPPLTSEPTRPVLPPPGDAPRQSPRGRAAEPGPSSSPAGDPGQAARPSARSPDPARLASPRPPGSAAHTRPARSSPGSRPRPNIVFVLTDDLSTDLLAFMPTVRDMMRRGVYFDSFFVAEPLCCPNRVSALTGRYPHSTGVVDNAGPAGGYLGFRRNGGQQDTFATALDRAGYRTALVGKYLNQYGVGPGGLSPIPPGWDEWYVTGDSAADQYTYTVNVNGHVVRHGTRARRDNNNTVLTRYASGFIRRESGKPGPFMLEIAPSSPHAPSVPSVRHADDFRGLVAPRGPAFNSLVVNGPPWLTDQAPIGPTRQRGLDAKYRARARSAATLDDMVAELQRELARTGQDRDTYFWFTSDNGFHLGEHRLRPGKRTAFEHDVRIPLVVTGPGVRKGARVRGLTSMIDVAPTFLDIAGMRPTAGMEGRSLLRWLEGPPPRTWRRALLIEYPTLRAKRKSSPPFVAMRTRRHMWVAYPDSGGREYYDLVRDPAQLVNLAGNLSPSRRGTLDSRLADLAGCQAGGCRVADRPR